MAVTALASFKNQHFVPRCYLRPFSVNEEGRAINLHNVQQNIFIENASIKGQCSASYFYGKDLRLEKLLKSSEDAYTLALRNFGLPGSRLSKMDKTILRHFTYLQHCRTEATLQRALTFVSEFGNVAWNGEAPEDWRATMQDAVLFGMRAFADTMHMVNDLKVCLIRNKTDRAFITSDDPAIMTNRWYAQNPKAKGLTDGIGSAGVFIFLPLTPRILCVVYDGDVYSIPNENGWTAIDKVTDVDAFNQHQFLTCLANVYFADWATLSQVREAFEIARPYRPAVRHEVITAVLDHEDGCGKSYRVVAREKMIPKSETLIHVKSIRPSPSRWPSVIKWRANPRIYSNGTRTGFVRRSRAEEYFGSDRPYKRVT